MIIALKYILATLLAVLPFICTHAFMKEEKAADVTTIRKNTLARLLDTYLPQVRNLQVPIGHFFARLYERMRKSDNSWKFHTALLIIVLLVYTCVNFSAAESVRDIISFTGSSTGGAAVQAAVQAGVYSPMESDMLALFMCLLFTSTLFLYRILDKIPEWIIMCWYFITFTKCLFWAVVANVDSSWFIMAEVESICLMAALYFPGRISDDKPKGRMVFLYTNVSRHHIKRRREQNTVRVDYLPCRQK